MPTLARWAVGLVVIGVVAVVSWMVLGLGQPEIKEIGNFKLTSGNGDLIVSFSAIDAESNFVATDGDARLQLYDNAGNLIYDRQFQIYEQRFHSAEGQTREHSKRYEYYLSIHKKDLVWVVPEGEFDTTLVRHGRAALRLSTDEGKTWLVTEQHGVTLCSAKEADMLVKQLYEQRQQERLKILRQRVETSLGQWLKENRYSLSEYGSFGYPLDLSIDDYIIVGEHAWAVGYLHGIGGYGHIFHSPDGGGTWEVQWRSSTWGPSPFDVEFLDESEGWVAANDAILHTIDGGKTWNRIWTRPGLGNWLREFEVIDRKHLRGRLSGG